MELIALAVHPGADAGRCRAGIVEIELAVFIGEAIGGVDAEVERLGAPIGDDDGIAQFVARVDAVAETVALRPESVVAGAHRPRHLAIGKCLRGDGQTNAHDGGQHGHEGGDDRVGGGPMGLEVGADVDKMTGLSAHGRSSACCDIW